MKRRIKPCYGSVNEAHLRTSYTKSDTEDIALMRKFLKVVSYSIV